MMMELGSEHYRDFHRECNRDVMSFGR